MFRKLSETVFASPQIGLAEIATAAAQGIALIINNRPEGESDDQTPGAAIEQAARAALPADGARVLVLLTDGEADSSDWRSGATELKQAGIGVVTTGIGTADGALLFDGGRPVRERTGGQVHSRLQPRTLADFTAAAGGRGRGAGSADRRRR